MVFTPSEQVTVFPERPTPVSPSEKDVQFAPMAFHPASVPPKVRLLRPVQPENAYKLIPVRDAGSEQGLDEGVQQHRDLLRILHIGDADGRLGGDGADQRFDLRIKGNGVPLPVQGVDELRYADQLPPVVSHGDHQYALRAVTIRQK